MTGVGDMRSRSEAIEHLTTHGLFAFEFDVYAEGAIGVAKLGGKMDWESYNGEAVNLTPDGYLIEKLVVVAPIAGSWEVRGLLDVPPGASFIQPVIPTLGEAIALAASIIIKI